jgi:truncated hemoglobin YjbI
LREAIGFREAPLPAWSIPGKRYSRQLERLGGYDAISAVVSDLLPRVRGDAELGHFWRHRAEDSLKRSRQHLTDFLCPSAGGPVYYSGRDMEADMVEADVRRRDDADRIVRRRLNLRKGA